MTTSQTPRHGAQLPYVPAQYAPTYGHPQQVPPPQTAPKPNVGARRWPWIVGIVVAFVVGIVVGGAGGSGGSTTAPVAAPASPVAPVPTQSAPAASAAPVAPVVPSGPASEVEDGTYQVGTDMAAGRYKTAGPPADSMMDMCYSARMKDDSGDVGSIIANDIVKGQSSITVKAGEFVKFSGGCTWTKQ